MIHSQGIAIDIAIDVGQSIEMDMSQAVSVIGDLNYPMYEGSYDVMPTVDGLKLATKRRSMAKDVNIEPIPIGSVSNTSGGRTVTIG